MSSVSDLPHANGGLDQGGSRPEADRAFLLALAAWGDRCRQPGDERDPGEIERAFVTKARARLAIELFESPGHTSEAESPAAGWINRAAALDRLRAMHRAAARVDLARVHSSWWIRALQEESPAVQRMVAASLPESMRAPLQAGLLLDAGDLKSDRAAAPDIASWALTLWSERLVGGETERSDDPPAVIMLSRLSPLASYRLCRRAGLCKLILAGNDVQGGRTRGTTQARKDWLKGRLATADEDFRARARRDVASSQVTRLPPRQRAARIGLTTVARLLAVAEPFRVRWALQHWPYSIAKLVRTSMPSASGHTSLVQGETLILQTAWDDLNQEGRLALPWPEMFQVPRGAT